MTCSFRIHSLGEFFGRRDIGGDGYAREVAALLVDVERRGRGEDRFAVLERGHSTGREGPAVAVARHLHDRGVVGLARPEVVAVQGVGESVVGHGHPGGPECLGGNLAAVEVGREGALRVVRPVEVAVELLEVEELLQRRRVGEVGGRSHRPTVSAGGDGAVVAWGARR